MKKIQRLFLKALYSGRPFVVFLLLCLCTPIFGFALTFLLVIPGSVFFLAAKISLDNVFSLFCFFQIACTLLFGIYLFRLRRLKLAEQNDEINENNDSQSVKN